MWFACDWVLRAAKPEMHLMEFCSIVFDDLPLESVIGSESVMEW